MNRTNLPSRAVLTLTALALIVTATLSLAGPLNPPAGPVTSTGRTTDEIYNRIPAPGSAPVGAFDGRTPIGTASFTISAPGSYVLTANLSSAGNVITIAADDVTLDLNGYSVHSTGTTTGNTGIFISGVRDNITIRNGNVNGGLIGIQATTATNVLVEGVRVSNAKTIGIGIISSASRNCVIRRCEINDTGSTTVAADGNLNITAIQLTASCCRVEDCTVSRLLYQGGGVGTMRGIFMNHSGAFGNMVLRCTVSHDAAIVGNGISMGTAGAVFRDNTVTNFSVPYFSGTNGGGNF